jgi:hypothetical protein
LLQAGLHGSGEAISLNSLIGCGAYERAMRDNGHESGGLGVKRDDAMAAITTTAPAFLLVETRGKFTGIENGGDRATHPAVHSPAGVC